MAPNSVDSKSIMRTKKCHDVTVKIFHEVLVNFSQETVWCIIFSINFKLCFNKLEDLEPC